MPQNRNSAEYHAQRRRPLGAFPNLLLGGELRVASG
jgi:hypothetical protein